MVTTVTTEATTEATTVTTTVTTATTTISPCGYPPALLNGEIVRITSTTAEYSCLTGFVMSGTKSIICSGTSWSTSLPSCAVIDQSPEVKVFEEWWMYFLAGILGLVALSLLCCLIWCCCCAPHSAKIWPAYSSTYGRQGCCQTCRKSSQEPETAYRDKKHSGSLYDLEDNVYYVPVNHGSDVYTKRPQSWAMAGSVHQSPRHEGNFRFVRVVQEAVDDDRNRKKAKEINHWKPHTNPIRNINTSTK